MADDEPTPPDDATDPFPLSDPEPIVENDGAPDLDDMPEADPVTDDPTSDTIADKLAFEVDSETTSADSPIEDDDTDDRIEQLMDRVTALEAAVQEAAQAPIFASTFPAWVKTDGTFQELLCATGSMSTFTDGRANNTNNQYITLNATQGMMLEMIDTNTAGALTTRRVLFPTGTASGTTSPLTTKGDLWGYSTTNTRVVGAAGPSILWGNSTSGTYGVAWGSSDTGQVDLSSSGTASIVTPTVNLTLGGAIFCQMFPTGFASVSGFIVITTYTSGRVDIASSAGSADSGNKVCWFTVGRPVPFP